MAVGGGGEGKEASVAVATAVEKGRREAKACTGFPVRRASFISWRIAMASAEAEPVWEYLLWED
jgi:hypothetical protein